MSRLPRCPTCDKPVDPASTPTMPFCSTRCRQIDLGRWLGEEYGLPIEREVEAEEHDSPD
jgi:endogenous inhibitor of DNA gyrase (YacG/DUF329 family)